MRRRSHGRSAATLAMVAAASSIGMTVAQAAAPDADRSAKAAAPSKADQRPAAPNYRNQCSCIPGGRDADAVRQPILPQSETAAHAPRSYQIVSPEKDAAHGLEPVISSYQDSGSSTKTDCGATASPPRALPKASAPNDLKGESKVLGVGMVTPAVQSGRSYVPPKPRPDTSKDDCMSCDE